jgi:hypothetical protein
MIVYQKQVLKILEIYAEELYNRANQPKNLNVEPEEEVDEDHKGPRIWRSEMEKAIKEMGDKKATGANDVPAEALKLLRDGGLNLLTQLMNNIYESGEWPNDFTEVTMVALKKKPKARKRTDPGVIRFEKKSEDTLREDQFGFRKGNGTRDATGMLRIISERTLDIPEEICVCFIDWQKAFDHVKWTKLMEILKKTGIDWRDRRLISKLYMGEC